MVRRSIATSQLLAIVVCHVVVASASTSAQQPKPEPGVAIDPATGDDSGNPLTADDALRMAIASAEALETTDAGARPALVQRIAELLETAGNLEPPSPWIEYVNAYVHAVSGRPGDAIQNIESFLKTRDGRNYWRAHRLLGDLLVNRYPRLAYASYHRAEALKDDEPSVLFGLARCMATRGELDAAVDYVTRAIVADTQDTVSYTHFLAQIFQQKGQWEQAVRTAEQAVAMVERKLAQSDDRRAYLYQVDGELALAMDAAAGLVANEPDKEIGYVLSARLLRKRADYALRASRLDEVQVLRKAVEQLGDKASKEILKAYADGLAETGQTEEAISAYEKLLLKDPASVYASDQIARLRSLVEAAEPVGDQ